jgi:hypothetical protein
VLSGFYGRVPPASARPHVDRVGIQECGRARHSEGHVPQEDDATAPEAGSGRDPMEMAPHYYGGQAVIEGVMMRGSDRWGGAGSVDARTSWEEGARRNPGERAC